MSRHRPLRFVLSASLIAVPGAALATNWTQVAASKSGAVIYLDRDSIQRRGSRALAWFKWDYAAARPEKGRNYVTEKDRREYDCADRTDRLREAVEYDQVGAVLRSFSWAEHEAKWSSNPPESVGDSMWKAVCAEEGATPPPG